MSESCAATSALEIWGGVECSHVRLPWGSCDQLERTGHAGRDKDLANFAALGLRTMRYPILWERHAGDPIDWSWADRRLLQMYELGIRPIIGLLHHGCGPLPGGFLDPDFVKGLADFARMVAERYPWIDAYTPINEPLTTARFSGLYGLWHPFLRDSGAFARIFLRQCEAIRAAMEAIRKINPMAQLIQTEDVGKTHATELLSYQAKWENERRWLTFDLLSGELGPGYPLWHYLRGAGLSVAELNSFRDRPCTPDILGMNHYVTGERLLDEAVEKYPDSMHGGNGRHHYTDVPAVRARHGGVAGCAALLRELWERYGRPVAITEVQLACTREEQVRWLAETWNAACEAKNAGIDVRAVTAWALAGAYDWDTLLLECKGSYECGAFDVQNSPPRMTAIGWAIRHLAEWGALNHPILATPGWWRRPCRLQFPPVSTATSEHGTAVDQEQAQDAPPLLLVGFEKGTEEIMETLCFQRGLSLRCAPRSAVLNFDHGNNLWRCRPWAVITVGHYRRKHVTADGHRSVARLRILCRHWQIPLNFCPEPDTRGTSSEGASLRIILQELLDHTIDESMRSWVLSSTRLRGKGTSTLPRPAALSVGRIALSPHSDLFRYGT